MILMLHQTVLNSLQETHLFVATQVTRLDSGTIKNYLTFIGWIETQLKIDIFKHLLKCNEHLLEAIFGSKCVLKQCRILHTLGMHTKTIVGPSFKSNYVVKYIKWMT